MGRRLISYDKPPTWEELDEETRQEFTCNGQIEKVDYFLNEEANTNTFYKKSTVDLYLEAISRRMTNYYGITDYWLYNALDDNPVEGKDVAVIGSLQPWYESICMSYGGTPYTIEYNKLETDDDRLNLTTVEEYSANPRKFDAAFSISTFEHMDSDGGTNPDYIDGNSELITYSADNILHVCKNILEDGGLFILTAPLKQHEEWDLTLFSEEILNIDVLHVKSIKVYFFRKKSETEWKQTDINDAKKARYNYPLPKTNVLSLIEIIK